MTRWFFGIAHATSMKDESEAEATPVLWWKECVQFVFNLYRILFNREAQTTRKPTDMCVDSQSR